MPEIVHLITGLATGGAEWALHNLLRGGLAERFDCHVVSLSDEGRLGPRIRALGVPLHTLGMPRGRPTVTGLIRLRRLVRDIAPSLLQGWMYHGNLAATVARALAPARPVVAWNIRQTLYDLRRERRLTRQIIRANRMLSSSPDIVLYNSALAREQHEAFGFDPARARVIPNGIDTERFSSCAQTRERTLGELGIDLGARVVGHVARLHPMKDHRIFLGAAGRVVERHPDVHFVLAGHGVSAENEALGSLLPESARGRFHLIDESPDIPGLMSAMDVFCLSSSWGEGFPNVVGEAMATGLPCVVTDIGDSATIVGDTGVVVAARDEAALAAGLEQLLRLPAEDRRALGARARARIVAHYSLASIVEQYASLYGQLMNGEGRG